MPSGFETELSKNVIKINNILLTLAVFMFENVGMDMVRFQCNLHKRPSTKFACLINQES